MPTIGSYELEKMVKILAAIADMRIYEHFIKTEGLPFPVDAGNKPGPDPAIRTLLKSIDKFRIATVQAHEPVDRLTAYTTVRKNLQNALEWYDNEIKAMKTQK